MSLVNSSITLDTQSGSQYKLIPTRSLGTVLVKVESGPDRFSSTMVGIAWNVSWEPIEAGSRARITGTCARTGRDGYTVDTSPVMCVRVGRAEACSVLVHVV